MQNRKARVIAFYLPQFHPIPENDKWWGKGFTEWVNVAKAKPLFKGHIQPRVPADLGFYDLRMPEVREAQAELAREAGIEGFCYWHYWFGNGKMLLEKPFQEVLKSGKPDFPFCLGWANHDWTNKTWKTSKRYTKQRILQKQEYFGETDYTSHFYYVLNAFNDKRYIYINDKPVFVVFNPEEIPDAKFFIDLWNGLAKKNGLPGVYFVGITNNIPNLKKEVKFFSTKDENGVAADRYQSILNMGFNAVNSRGYSRAKLLANGVINHYGSIIASSYFGAALNKVKYKELIKHMYVAEDTWENVYPTIIPNYDRSPRSGKNAVIWYGSTPELFKEHVENALDVIKEKNKEHKVLFLKSWNEWGETNYIEPDITYGNAYLDNLKKALSE